jgi:amino acid transporter
MEPGPKDIESSNAIAAAIKTRTEDEDLKDPAHEQRNVGTLNRKLKARHVQFLALSGAIGTGLFVGSGQALSLAGPLSAFLAYLITGFNLYAVINSLGEMAAYLPLPGAVPVFAAQIR